MKRFLMLQRRLKRRNKIHLVFWGFQSGAGVSPTFSKIEPSNYPDVAWKMLLTAWKDTQKAE